MSYLFKLFLIISLFANFAFAAGASKSNENTPPTSLSKGDILDYIAQERKILRGKNKVNLVDNFISKSYVMKMVTGNKQQILNLGGIDLSGEDLSGVVMTSANLKKANLSKANLSRSDLISADLSNVDLSGANLKGADLSGAHFETTNIDGANFEGANLFGATFKKMKSSDLLESLKKRTNSYVNLDREPLPDYY